MWSTGSTVIAGVVLDARLSVSLPYAFEFTHHTDDRHISPIARTDVRMTRKVTFVWKGQHVGRSILIVSGLGGPITHYPQSNY